MIVLRLNDCILTPLHLPIAAQIPRRFNHVFIPSPASTVPRRSFPRIVGSQCLTRASRDQESGIQSIHSSEIEVVDDEEGEDNDSEDGFWSESGFRGRKGETDYDRDPEFAEIIGTTLDDPEKARSKVPFETNINMPTTSVSLFFRDILVPGLEMSVVALMEERLRKKRNKILQPKTGSAVSLKVTFNKFDFSNSYIWFEFYNTPLEKDITLICDTIRSWHIIGRLGGCNSMNMQLSQSPMEKRPSYDAIQGANVTPTTFYNIGDFEVQHNLARIWVDIGTSEPLLLDILINALTQISSDYVGIKQLVFGGSEFENWKEDLTSEDAGYSSHKI